MSDLQERTKTVDIPPNTGIDGFLHVVREVLQLPRVLKVIIDKAGRLTFTQLCRSGEDVNLNVAFEHLEPYHIIRNARTQELSYPVSLGGCAVLAAMLDAVCTNGFTPIAFVAAPQTVLWTWLYFGDDLNVTSRDTVLGYPLYTDRNIPETALVLCAGVDRTTALIDTKLSLKIEMHRGQPVLDEEVEIS